MWHKHRCFTSRQECTVQSATHMLNPHGRYFDQTTTWHIFPGPWLIDHTSWQEFDTHRDVWPTPSWFCCSWAPWACLCTGWLCVHNTATHRNTLQRIATHCNALQHTQNTATHCKTLQRGTHRDVWPTSSWFCCSWVPWAYLSTNWLFIWTKWNQLSFIAFLIYVHQIHRACHQWFTPILHCIWPHQTCVQNNKGPLHFQEIPTKFTKSTEWTACFTTRCVCQKVKNKSAFTSFSWNNLHIQSTFAFPPLLVFTFIYIHI